MLPDEHVAVFIPTTPSPVNGFYFYVKKSEIIELNVSVDRALKYIVSMGVRFRTKRGTRHSIAWRLSQLGLTMRTHYCGAVTAADIGNTVTLCGWAHRRRDHGGVIFIDLRDREGMVQVVIDPDTPEAFKLAEDVRSEFVLKIDGLVRAASRRHRKPQPADRHDRGADAESWKCSTPR